MQIYHYHPTTREFLGVGTADASPLEPGKYLIPAHATQVIPPMPQAGTVRKFIAGAWVLEPLAQDEAPVDPGYEPSIHDLAAAKLAAINEGKNVALDAGFVHDGVLFDSDYKARLAYLEAATQFQLDPEFSTPWKASTGHWVTMDAALFAALIPAYRAHVQACFAWQGAREQEVAAALALVTPVLGPSTPALDENGNQIFDENGNEVWNPGEPTGEVDESAARAALSAVAETM